MTPEFDDIMNFLRFITAPWGEGPQPGSLELRALGQSPTRIAQFQPSQLQEAADQATKWNLAAYNVYACINPVAAVGDQRLSAANDKQILRAHFAFADCDEINSSDIVETNAPPYDFKVITGTRPFERCHYYWRLNPAVSDLAKWTELQKDIARTYNADPVVCNPSRIMRVAGTITHPNPKKRDKGYATELTKLLKGDM